MNYLVIGGNSAIGIEIKKQLTAAGHTVLSSSRDAGDDNNLSFDALINESLDLSVPALEGLVYLPGTINLKPFQRLSDDDFRNDFEINFLGAVRVIRQVLPLLKKSEGVSSILLFSSVAVRKGLSYHTSIAAAKGAIEGFTKSLGAELAPGVRVNAIAPSLTDTPLANKLLSNEQRREASADRHPLKRVGRPEDIANLATFLLSTKSDWITGQVMGVDGGLSAF